MFPEGLTLPQLFWESALTGSRVAPFNAPGARLCLKMVWRGLWPLKIKALGPKIFPGQSPLQFKGNCHHSFTQSARERYVAVADCPVPAPAAYRLPKETFVEFPFSFLASDTNDNIQSSL